MRISRSKAAFIRSVIADARAHRWNGPGPMVLCVYSVDSTYRTVYNRVVKPPTVAPRAVSPASPMNTGYPFGLYPNGPARNGAELRAMDGQGHPLFGPMISTPWDAAFYTARVQIEDAVKMQPGDYLVHTNDVMEILDNLGKELKRLEGTR